jgi:hypothetical protein
MLRTSIIGNFRGKPACLLGRESETAAMRHSEFVIGGTFWSGGTKWRCTDIGTRTVVAIRLDRVEVVFNASGTEHARRTLNEDEAEAEGWFNGPPYAVAESVFDEDEIAACSFDAKDFVTTSSERPTEE